MSTFTPHLHDYPIARPRHVAARSAALREFDLDVVLAEHSRTRPRRGKRR